MKLEKHAEKELRRAGLFDPDSDYGGMIGEAVMKLVRAFAGEGHSGGSAMLTLAAFDRVARFKTLTPITSDPEEWMEVGDNMWQNKRHGSCFSRDGGKTWYDIDAHLHVGDVVRKKNSGQLMTVETVERTDGRAYAARCVWFFEIGESGGGEFRRRLFDVDDLDRVDLNLPRVPDDATVRTLEPLR